MLIEDSITIHAPIEKVWETFTDITCWDNWNTVLRNVSAGRSEVLTQGDKIRFCVYPFRFPVYFEPAIDEVIPFKKVVWTGGKMGVTARHEFLFKELENAVRVVSKESFRGIPLNTLGLLFPRSRLKKLTAVFLRDLKKAAER